MEFLPSNSNFKMDALKLQIGPTFFLEAIPFTAFGTQLLSFIWEFAFVFYSSTHSLTIPIMEQTLTQILKGNPIL